MAYEGPVPGERYQEVRISGEKGNACETVPCFAGQRQSNLSRFFLLYFLEIGVP